MREARVNTLLKDAIYWHLIGEGYSEYAAKIEADRIMAKMRLIKEDKL
ncbi:MAG: hypothetical protein JSW60_05185 [Thermoplasmatales archaeon]|nr:MAG: hypothetical protein JSW60_05185 [Thermoplasmatales archaeon]